MYSPLKISGYYGKWNAYEGVQIKDLPFENFDYFYYAFLKPDLQNMIDEKYLDLEKEFETSKHIYYSSIFDANFKGNFFELKLQKFKFPNVKIIASIGGWEHSENFKKILLENDKILKFIQTISEFLKEYKNIFDGVDIDFEKMEEIKNENFNFFIKNLYISLKNKFILTMCVPGDPHRLKLYNFEKLDNYVETFNIMTYDYAAPEYNNEYTGHHCCAYSNIEDPIKYRRSLSSFSIAEYFKNIKISTRKLNLGVAFYGHCFQFKEKGKPPFFESIGSYEKSTMSYKEIKQNYEASGWRWDNLANAAYIVDYGKKLFITFDEEYSIKEKMKLAKERNYNGIFIWEVGMDENEFELIKKIHSMK